MTYELQQKVEDVLRRYGDGQRQFLGVHLNNADFGGANLEGATFQGWLSSASFIGSNLRYASFVNCNVKCADFRSADLRGATFSGSSIDAIWVDKARIEGSTFIGAYCQGYQIVDPDFHLGIPPFDPDELMLEP
jgi:uncharacterized protein YjbI with pentapeptide repeats